MTNPKHYSKLFEGLPTEIPALCRVVQGLLIHIFWAERYGLNLSEERKQEVQIRSIARKLARIQELDERPLTVGRPLDKRLVSNCRDFTLLLTSILRHQGVPARARCGFGVYFEPNHYEDHWVCEYWNASEGHWVIVDSQLDDFQRKALQIKFNTYDMPPGQFLPAGRAWQLCRAGEVDPDHFGIFNLHGLWFVRSNLVRDLAALNTIELLPWDGWGLIDEKKDEELTEEDWALLDRVAVLTLADNSAFAEMRALYEENVHLRVPPVIRSWSGAGNYQKIALADA
jgi:hypothetical protein